MCTLAACEGAAPAETTASSCPHPRFNMSALVQSLSWCLHEGCGRVPHGQSFEGPGAAGAIQYAVHAT